MFDSKNLKKKRKERDRNTQPWKGLLSTTGFISVVHQHGA